MIGVVANMKANPERFLEERISVQSFKSSEALKEEIGSRVRSRQQEWTFVKLASRGPYLYLTFEPKKG